MAPSLISKNNNYKLHNDYWLILKNWSKLVNIGQIQISIGPNLKDYLTITVCVKKRFRDDLTITEMIKNDNQLLVNF